MGSIADVAEVLLELGLSSSVTDEERAVASVMLTRAEGAVRKVLRYDPTQQSRTEFYPRQDYNASSGRFIWETSDTQAFIRRVSEAATDELQVQHIPVRSTPAIQLFIDYDGRSGARDGAFASDTLKVEGDDFWPNYDGEDSDGNSLCRDGIIRSIGSWPTTAGSVKIVYTGGYSDSELHGQDAIIDASPILNAVIEEARRRVEKMFVRKKSSLVGFAAGPKTSESLGDYSYSVDASSASKLYGGDNDLLPATIESLQEFVHYGPTM